MLVQVFENLDRWIQKQNGLVINEGGRLIEQCNFKILGQSALFEAPLSLALAATGDLDAYTNASYAVCKYLDTLLEEYGMHLDPLSKAIWMPEETEYTSLYQGEYVEVLLAKPEYVLLSKAIKDPKRNREIVIEYLASAPSRLFMDLCEKYQVDLENFLKSS